MRKTWWLGVLLLGIAGVATGSAREDMRKQAEASMVLEGTIDIERDGSVSGYVIDQREKVPDFVLAHIEGHVPAWRFEPVLVDGQPAQVRAGLGLRVVARPAADGAFDVSISGASFATRSDSEAEVVTGQRMTPPTFPSDIYDLGGKGDVYVVLKINRDGKVADAVVEQINLKVVGNRQQVERIRKRLAQTTLRTARTWRFKPPTAGRDVDDEFWSVRVPVSYAYPGEEPVYGAWEGYVPGPRQRAHWLEAEASGNDALAEGGVYPVGGGITLRTPLGPTDG